MGKSAQLRDIVTLDEALDELDDDRMIDNVMMIGMMMILLVVIISALGRMNWSVPVIGAAEVAAAGYQPVAAGVGLLWHQLNPAGQPNDLRMIAENSTGAFESMLLGVTT